MLPPCEGAYCIWQLAQSTGTEGKANTWQDLKPTQTRAHLCMEFGNP